MLTREQLHTLIETLPEEELAAAAQAIEGVTDPILRALLLAPEDDEPLTAEDIVAIEEGRADPESITWEHYLAERARARSCPGA